jgi:hypothetical protein
MTSRPTVQQVDVAIHRAADAARTLTRYPDRITMLPVPPTDEDLVDERFWFIGWIVVVGEPHTHILISGHMHSKHSARLLNLQY